MSPVSLFILTCLTMLAFAGNSLLCRLALQTTPIDATSFTLLRLLAGAISLWLLVRWRDRKQAIAPLQGNWIAALSLFVYAAGFSFAYIQLSAATGALLLFAAVQVTMISAGLARGERLNVWQWMGFMLALVGLLYMLSPGLSAPAPLGAGLMLLAGVAWGLYSLQAKSADPLATTCGNFVRSLVFALALGLVFSGQLAHSLSAPNMGMIYALLSGAIMSGLGYALWYSVLHHWSATQAASLQLSVPPLAALAALPMLGEMLSLRLLVATAAILGGIALVIRNKQSS